MTTYMKSIEIAAPPERVRAVMTDVEGWLEWTPSMTSAARRSFTWRMSAPGRRSES